MIKDYINTPKPDLDKEEAKTIKALKVLAGVAMGIGFVWIVYLFLTLEITT